MSIVIAVIAAALGVALGYGVHSLAGSYQARRFRYVFTNPSLRGGEAPDQKVSMRATLIEATVIRLVLSALVIAAVAYLYTDTRILPDTDPTILLCAAVSFTVAYFIYTVFYIIRSARSIWITGRSKENAL